MSKVIYCVRNSSVRCLATPDVVEGRQVLEVAYHAGTYGSGGPGFFGLRLSVNAKSPEEWLLCTIWGAGNWMRVNERLLLAHPDQYEEQRPMRGVVYRRTAQGTFESTGDSWDEFSPLIVGKCIQHFECKRRSSCIVAENTLIEIAEDAASRPPYYGDKSQRRLTWRDDLRKVWVMSNTAAIKI